MLDFKQLKYNFVKEQGCIRRQEVWKTALPWSEFQPELSRKNFVRNSDWYETQTTDIQWRHKSKISEELGLCGKQNMLWPYLKIWEWEWVFGRSMKDISTLGVYIVRWMKQLMSICWKHIVLLKWTMLSMKSKSSKYKKIDPSRLCSVQLFKAT